MSSLTLILIDVILLVIFLMLSLPLPVCFAGALLFLSLFGDGLAQTPDDDLYKIVTALFAVPQKLLRRNETCRKIAESGIHLMQKKPLDGIVIPSKP